MSHRDPVDLQPPYAGAAALRWALTALALALAGCAPREAPPPNIVVYLIDTLRADHVGAYGYERPTTPNIDRLAAEGILFERAYAHDSRTLGSVPSLLASRYTPSHGVEEFGNEIGPGVVPVAEVLRRAGYQTASFITNVNAGEMAGLDRGFELYHDAIKTHRDREARRSLPETAVFEWLDARREAPFFAYIHTAEPHRPYIPPPPYDTMFNPGYEGAVTGFYQGEEGYGAAVAPADVEQVVALYDGEVRFADAALGRFLEGLERRGLRQGTVVFLTSDHGEELADRGGWNHGHTVYEELLRVPLVASGEPWLPAGRRLEPPVQLIDLAPTLLELAGLPDEPAFEGRSLLPLIAGRDRGFFARRPVIATTTLQPRKRALIQHGWKLILTDGGEPELYHLERDPRERRNLAAVEPDRTRRMSERLERWSSARQRAGASDGSPTAAELERLRALGYVD